MKRLALSPAFLALLSLGAVFSSAPEEHPSEASRVFATWADEAGTEEGAEARAAAALAFLETLDSDETGLCRFDLEHEERRTWTNVPSSSRDRGVRLGDLDEAQLKRLAELLATTLSPAGYAKVRDIMLADDRLLRDGQPREGFGAAEFRIVLFGEPSAEGPWALQLDGHHLGLNLSFDGEHVSLSPSFLGTQPSTYSRDDSTVAPLRGEVDDAFALIQSLEGDSLELALVSERRGRIQAGPGRDGFVPEPHGVPCSRFDAEQRALLLGLIRQYVSNLPEPVARARMAVLEQELDEMVFAWSGPIDNPSDVSYRVQGPSLIIEYACQDLGGDPLDHLHSIYRDPKNEYGTGF